MEQHIVRMLVVAAAVWGSAGIARADIQRKLMDLRLQRIGEECPVDVRERRTGQSPELYAQRTALPPEQRQQMRQQMREHWQNMPPQAQREYRQESRERWQQMPSEERQRMRDEMREQRRGYGGRDGDRDFRR